MASNRIVVFGSIVQDLVSYTDRFPRPGESVRGTSFQAGAGGKGANQCVAAARFGANVTMIGAVGEDIFGESNIKSLAENGVDTSRILKSATSHTATATITVNSEAENSIVVTLGANLDLLPSVADANADIISTARIVICQGEIPEQGNRRAFEIARANGVTTFLNPAPGDANMDKSILELVDIVCTNENEAEFITGLTDTTAAALRIIQMGPHTAIITIGPQGVLLARKGDAQVQHIPIQPVKAVDTTGAGDCFCGTLAALLTEQLPIEHAVLAAARVASLSVTRKGTQSSYWKLDEIRAQHPDFLTSTTTTSLFK